MYSGAYKRVLTKVAAGNLPAVPNGRVPSPDLKQRPAKTAPAVKTAPTTATAPAKTKTRADARLLRALEHVETGGQSSPATAVGDHGLAVGHLQLHPNYVIDATGRPPVQNGADIRNSRQASNVAVIRYLQRYLPNGTDDERALLHHYGPSWRKFVGSEGANEYLRKFHEGQRIYDKRTSK